MTQPSTGAVPTPRDLATALRRPGAAPAPAPAAPASPFDRHRWEQALIATPLPHHAARMLGWGLAHVAGTTGHLGPQEKGHLARTLRLSPKQIRLSLVQLEAAGLIRRPDVHTWQADGLTRPITLTLPAAAARRVPPSTGQAR
ncbi:hypothetical protein [Streptomyces sp. TRM68416]|uniref:hypothetical protein n=1 Tax=Streptomyces sp. TRM68416 TaxID=2758412 RepID=UPI0016618C40|nr:hypothetical protein [Streptomyces sp. TRM68416]MBD0837393.1 hypothetical protein [Streptomyces sp. TRM68416]